MTDGGGAGAVVGSETGDESVAAGGLCTGGSDWRGGGGSCAMSETGRISTARKIPRTINARRGGAARTFRGQNDDLTVAFYDKSRP